MSAEEYYQKYWKGGLKKNVFGEPPSWNKMNLDRHFKFFEKYIGARILDAGAGDGTFLNFVISRKKNIAKAIALEMSEEAILRGKEKFPELEFRKGRIERHDFANESFDTIFAIDVLEHLLDVEQCLAELARVLKRGGYFCVSTTDFNFLKKIIIASFFWDRYFSPRSPHIRFFTKKNLNSICGKNGLEKIDYKWNGSYWGLMPKGQLAVFRKK